jgi:hypothetical protein
MCSEIVDRPGRARTARLLPSRFEETTQLYTEEKLRPAGVDCAKSSLLPAARRVLVNAQQARDFLNGVIAMNLDPARVWKPGAHWSRSIGDVGR